MQALTNATTATTNSTIELIILSAVPALVTPTAQRVNWCRNGTFRPSRNITNFKR
jgi:hypothetical protein